MHDRRELVEWGGPNAHYLWIVRSSGTHLIRLGVHPKHTEHGVAALRIIEREHPEHARTFLVCSEAVKEIPRERAMSVLATTPQRYEVDGDTVIFSRKGAMHEIAHMRIEREVRRAAQPLYHVWFASRGNLGADHMGALRLVAQCAVASRAQSLFASPATIHVDDLDLVDAMAGVRRGELELAAA